MTNYKSMNTENTDPIELNKFREMSEDWWNPTGSCRPLHELNPTRLQYIDDKCDLRGKTVLDIGCGGGILSESMAKRDAFVTGIDAEATLIKVAQEHAEQQFAKNVSLQKLQYQHTTAEDFAENHAKTFDVITCLEMLEHVPDPTSIVIAAAKLIKPNGHLFFSTLNRTPKSFLFAILGAEYVLKLLPRGTHQYQKFIKPSELEVVLRNAGLHLVELQGLDYNPFTHKARLMTDVSVNYLAHVKAS
jgi:2-polyprenyl-6-hydroxyphenyl methylase/3-demethylubiquinone-9 3-methyltransferase